MKSVNIYRSMLVAVPLVAGINLWASTTIVIDFKTPAEGNTLAITGDTVSDFNYVAYGISAGQYSTLQASMMTELNRDYHNIPTKATDSRSPIPAGKELDIDFVVGSIGSAPSNGATTYYYAQIGTAVSGPNTGGGTLGVAGVSAVRNSNGTVGSAANHAVVCSIFSDAIQTLGGLTPSNALTSGNITFTTYAVEGTLAHELAHTLSLSHIDKAGSIQMTNLPPLMGTGAIDLPNQDRIGDREFSLSGTNSQGGGAAVFQVDQLVSAVGLRSIPEPSSAMLVAVVGTVLTRRRRRAASMHSI